MRLPRVRFRTWQVMIAVGQVAVFLAYLRCLGALFAAPMHGLDLRSFSAIALCAVASWSLAGLWGRLRRRDEAVMPRDSPGP